MHPYLAQKQKKTILDDQVTMRKLALNKKRNEEQDQTDLIDEAAAKFRYEDCRHSYWNPEEFSLFYGTTLWEQATQAQKLLLNHLFWIAYYSQIVSAEITTIYFNSISAAGLYTLEDFRLVCDTLELESTQERTHINAFKKVSEDVEWELFGERLFTYPMKSVFGETMMFSNCNAATTFWRKLKLHAFSHFSSENAFLASQYLLVRGLRTINGKLVQQRLSKFYLQHSDKENAPIPAAISYYHFLDESHHFNTSKIVGQDIARSLEPPTAFETWVINQGVKGCQADHFYFTVAVNGIFWYDPAMYKVIYKIFRSKHFGMNDQEARNMLGRCFAEESEGMLKSYETHRIAVESYKAFVEPITYLNPSNRDMAFMANNTMEATIKRNQKALQKFVL